MSYLLPGPNSSIPCTIFWSSIVKILCVVYSSRRERFQHCAEFWRHVAHLAMFPHRKSSASWPEQGGEKHMRQSGASAGFFQGGSRYFFQGGSTLLQGGSAPLSKVMLWDCSTSLVLVLATPLIVLQWYFK